MKRKLIEAKLIDLIEGRLTAEEHKQISAAIESDPDLKRLYQGYLDLLAVESKLSQEKIELGRSFVVRVMERLEETERPLFWRLYMKLALNRRFVAVGIVSVAALVVFVDLERNRTLFNEVNIIEESLQGPAASNSIQVQAKVEQGRIKAKQKASEAMQKASEAMRGTESKYAPSDLSISSSYSPALEPAERSLSHYANYPSVERYGQYSENPRILVRNEPLSTFSIDVDTGSYTNMRRFVREGQIPPAESVRVEEFLNYFSYDYPKQYTDPFKVYTEIAPSPLDSKRHILKIGVKSRDIGEQIKPWNLVFLVDVSGSMDSADKLGLLKQALKLLVHGMRKDDKVSLVTYAGEAGTLLEGAGKDRSAEILQKIDQLGAGGSTNGSGGINEAYRIAQKQLLKEGENRVILATDGDFNVGVTSDEELIKIIEEKRKQGVTLTTLGFGAGNLNERMIEQLANKGDGNYFYIDSFKEARKVFETDLLATIETVAKDVKVQVEFNPEHVAAYRLIGYDNRLLNKEDFKNDAIDAGETGSGHTVTALYEIALTGSPFAKELESELRYQGNKAAATTPVAGNSELAFVKIRYKEPTGSDSRELSFPIQVSEVKAESASASADFKFAASVHYLAADLRNSALTDKHPISEVLRLARDNMGKDTEGYRREFVDLVESLASLKRK